MSEAPSTGGPEDKDLIREQLADATENRVLHAESSLTRSDLSWGRHAVAADRAAHDPICVPGGLGPNSRPQ